MTINTIGTSMTNRNTIDFVDISPTHDDSTDHVNQVISQWKREKPDLQSDEMRLIARLLNCLKLIETRLNTLYSQYHLNHGEFDVLCALRRSGKPYKLTPTELFSTLMITSGTMTNRLQQLQKKGFIIRSKNPLDARSLMVELSPEGLSLIDDLIYQHVAIEKSLNQLLPDEMRSTLESGLGYWLHQLQSHQNQ